MGIWFFAYWWAIGEGQAREDARGWKNYERSEQEDANRLKIREETLLEQESDKNNKKNKNNRDEIPNENRMELLKPPPKCFGMQASTVDNSYLTAQKNKHSSYLVARKER